jgi:hypothetical protein
MDYNNVISTVKTMSEAINEIIRLNFNGENKE